MKDCFNCDKYYICKFITAADTLKFTTDEKRKLFIKVKCKEYKEFKEK